MDFADPWLGLERRLSHCIKRLLYRKAVVSGKRVQQSIADPPACAVVIDRSRAVLPLARSQRAQ